MLQRCFYLITLFAAVNSEYCYYREAKEGPNDYLHCEFFGRNLPIEGISLIHLKHNTTIPTIKKSLIQPFKNLTTLYITAASVEKIEPGAFDGLQLEILDLFHNNLTNFEKGTFGNLTTLTFLDVSYNKFKTLETDVFLGLVSLEWLSLNANGISSIQKGVFKNTGNLRALHMNFNNLSVLESGCFSNLPYLESLDLSFNALTKLDSHLFSDLFSLHRLEIGHNGLENLSDRMFEKSPLRYLDLSQNKINKIDEKTFYNLTELEYLDVSVNRIEQLNISAILSDSPNLREVYLHGNSLKCEILKDTINVLQEKNVYVTNIDILQPNFIGDMMCISKNETVLKPQKIYTNGTN